jgi:hypothetical protein
MLDFKMLDSKMLNCKLLNCKLSNHPPAARTLWIRRLC